MSGVIKTMSNRSVSTLGYPIAGIWRVTALAVGGNFFPYCFKYLLKWFFLSRKI